jgi:tRNA U55 pseudouridine synthase TruB
LKTLHRTASGPFRISSAVSLEELEESAGNGMVESLAVNPYMALSHLPDFPLKDSGLALVRHGRSPGWSDIDSLAPTGFVDGSLLRLTRNGVLTAVAEYRSSGEDLPHIHLKRVFI